MPEKILEVKNLKTIFYTDAGIIPAVDDISFSLSKGETLGIVGESGCGKSVTALSIMGLIQSPAGKIESGEIVFNGQNLLKLPEEKMRKIRGRDISMIFQEPMTSLNPVMQIGDQLGEVFVLHHQISPREAKEKSIEMLHKVGIPSPATRIKEYPHALSGGMRQRVMIAMALACRPQILICDEPTTALDVTIQAQILDLMKKLQEDFAMAIIFITHDLGVVADICDEVMIMYAGHAVEKASTQDIFKNPYHPYTQALLRSIPHMGKKSEQELFSIPGMVPDLLHLPKHCYFSSRCFNEREKCRQQLPNLEQMSDGRWLRCLFSLQGQKK